MEPLTQAISSERAATKAFTSGKDHSSSIMDSTSTNKQRSIPFFALPRELRDHIYDALHQSSDEVKDRAFSFRFPPQINYPCDQFEEEYLSREPADGNNSHGFFRTLPRELPNAIYELLYQEVDRDVDVVQFHMRAVMPQLGLVSCHVPSTTSKPPSTSSPSLTPRGPAKRRLPSNTNRFARLSQVERQRLT